MNPINETTQQAQEKAIALRVSLSSKENRFINFFENATPIDWEDWTWQISHRIRTKETLSEMLDLTSEEIQGIEGCGQKLTMAIPPYFASLIDPNDSNCPIRRQCIPVKDELIKSANELEDPCAEDNHSPVPGLVHRYPDRVLFLVSEMCAMYCRHCTRSRMVGEGRRKRKTSHYEDAYNYIRSNKKIRDVLISGGDPLMLSDETLEDIIKNIKAIAHVELVRIGTRVPVTMPQRITGNLVAMLKKYSPLWMSIHFNHPKEITKRVRFACELLSDNGIPLGSQTVLLKGINDKPYIMKKLMHELLKIRVRPYYIYQCDPIVGSSHFRTPISTGIGIIDKLRGHTTGYAVPKYVIDAPGGGGKIPIEPNAIISQDQNTYVLRNFAGEQYTHHDPQ
ncbi:MAG: KamA family radical SAM protein [Candidatus Omnitrophica bacterium]|nr:KamA family radical SAM protein [Candidatus Omnitrophota bacterium]